MAKAHFESPPEGLAHPVEPKSESGGGAIDSPPAKRVWRKPSIRVLSVGATASGLGAGLNENSDYAMIDCSNPYYADIPFCQTS